VFNSSHFILLFGQGKVILTGKLDYI